MTLCRVTLLLEGMEGREGEAGLETNKSFAFIYLLQCVSDMADIEGCCVVRGVCVREREEGTLCFM